MREPLHGCGWSAEPVDLLGEEGVTSLVRLTIATETGDLVVLALDPVVALGIGVDLVRASKAEPGDWTTEEFSDA